MRMRMQGTSTFSKYTCRIVSACAAILNRPEHLP